MISIAPRAAGARGGWSLACHESCIPSHICRPLPWTVLHLHSCGSWSNPLPPVPLMTSTSKSRRSSHRHGSFNTWGLQFWGIFSWLSGRLLVCLVGFSVGCVWCRALFSRFIVWVSGYTFAWLVVWVVVCLGVWWYVSLVGCLNGCVFYCWVYKYSVSFLSVLYVWLVAFLVFLSLVCDWLLASLQLCTSFFRAYLLIT
jgi:hypothetical protein